MAIMLRLVFLATLAFTDTINAAVVSKDARCGLDVGQTCLKSSFGSCCSQYGWCGSTPAYCGTGCQIAFGSCSNKPPASASSAKNASPSSTRTQASIATQSVSKNARCGSAFGGQTCLGSQFGDCCSQYNYCGSTADYCGPQNSCQVNFGRCNSMASSSRPSASTSTSSGRLSTFSTSKSLSSSLLPSSSVAVPSASPTTSPQISSNSPMAPSSASSSSTGLSSSPPAQIQSPILPSSAISSSIESLSPSLWPTSAFSSGALSASSTISSAASIASSPSSPTALSTSSIEPSATPSSSLPASSSTPSPSPPAPSIPSQFVVNPSFETGFAPWRFQGGAGFDTTTTGVFPIQPRSGANSYRAVGAANEWFVDIIQTIAFVPGLNYKLEVWARSNTADCTVGYQMLGNSDSFDTKVTYSKGELVVMAATAEMIAASQSDLLVDIFCPPGTENAYAIFVDDITITTF